MRNRKQIMIKKMMAREFRRGYRAAQIHRAIRSGISAQELIGDAGKIRSQIIKALKEAQSSILSNPEYVNTKEFYQDMYEPVTMVRDFYIEIQSLQEPQYTKPDGSTSPQWTAHSYWRDFMRDINQHQRNSKDMMKWLSGMVKNLRKYYNNYIVEKGEPELFEDSVTYLLGYVISGRSADDSPLNEITNIMQQLQNYDTRMREASM